MAALELVRAKSAEIPFILISSPPLALPHGTETLLLVENDPSLREMAGRLLERLGYSVLVAANGMNALNVIEQRGNSRLDLLFTDIAMPQMDGKELSDRVRGFHPEIKVLFTSGYRENAVVHQGLLTPGVAPPPKTIHSLCPRPQGSRYPGRQELIQLSVPL